VDHGKPYPLRRNDPLRAGEHFQVGGLDRHGYCPRGMLAFLVAVGLLYLHLACSGSLRWR